MLCDTVNPAEYVNAQRDSFVGRAARFLLVLVQSVHSCSVFPAVADRVPASYTLVRRLG
jgi:hypothetical protein